MFYTVFYTKTAKTDNICIISGDGFRLFAEKYSDNAPITIDFIAKTIVVH